MSKSASGVKAGAAYIELMLRDQVSAGLSKAEKRLQAFADKVDEIGTLVATAGAAMTAFGGAILAVAGAGVAAFTKIAGDFSDLAAQTGLSVRLMSELETALKDAGSSVEEFASSTVKMRKAIFAAFNGSDEAKHALDALGLSAADLVMLSADEQFLKIADALSRMKNPTERMAIAMQLFGKSAYKMLPVLEAGAGGIEAFREKARQMGFSLSGETADAADALGTQIEILQDQLGRVAVAIGEVLLPPAQAFVGILQSMVGNVIGFVRENQGLVFGLVAGGAAIAAVGTVATVAGGALIGLAAAIKGGAVVVGVLGAAVSALSVTIGSIVPAATAAWAAVTGPVGLAVAGIAAVGAAIAWATGLLSQTVSSLGAAWDAAFALTADLRDAWLGVTDAIAAGDLALAGEVAIAGLKAAFLRGLANIVQDAVIPFVAKVGELLSNIPGLGSLGYQASMLRGIAPLIDFGAKDAEKELDTLSARAAKARREAERTKREIMPLDIGAPTPPEIETPKVKDVKEKLDKAAAEIQTRMSAMGGFNATSLGGMFGGADDMVAQQKRSNEFLAKLLDQGKRERERLVWS